MESWWPPSIFYWEVLQCLLCSAFPQGYFPHNWRPLCKLLLPQPPEHLSPCLGPSSDTTHLTGRNLLPLRVHLQSGSGWAPYSKWKEESPLHKVLTRSHHEAFSRDSKLVWKAREEYFQENHPCFNNKTSCNMMDVFWNMVESTGLLSSEIYEIRENWTGW